MALLKVLTVLFSVSLGGFLFLDKLEREIVYPFDDTRVAPGDLGLAMRAEQFESGGQKLVIWVAEAKPGKPVILYFHGNAGNLAARAGRFQRFIARGYGVVAPAYRGSSGSSGTPSEKALVFDASRILTRITTYSNAAPVVIYGESLGSAVALAAIERSGKQPAALVLEAPFTTLRAVAQKVAPQLEPLLDRMKSEWNSLERIKALSAPLLILHGTKDQLIPIEHGRQLFVAARSKHKDMKEIKGGQHTDLWRSDVLPGLWSFIDRHALP